MRVPILILTATALAACIKAPLPFELHALEVPATGASLGPRLSGGPGGELILSWMEPGEELAALQYSRFHDSRWGAAATVISGTPMFVNWADLPSVVPVAGGRLAAHWLQPGGNSSHSYDVVFVRSDDGGASWSQAMTPHSDGTDTEHGFVSMAQTDPGTILVWLDGRRMANPITDDPAANGMTLRAATISADLALHDEQLIDELVCDCCQTDIAMSDTGPVLVYRDRTVAEIRDIAVTRLVDGAWSAGVAVARDGWEISGCPVNGPSISARGSRVVVAWFSAAHAPAVKVAFSNDGGQRFSPPIEVVSGNTLGRCSVVMMDDGTAAASWLEHGSEAGIVKVRRIGSDGSLGAVRTVTVEAGALSVPQMEKAGNLLVFAWTSDDGIASASIPIAAL